MTRPLPAAAGTHVPVLTLDDVLLVTVQRNLDDRAAEWLRQDIARAVTESTATGVVIDVSGVEVVDSFLGRVLADIAPTVKLLAAQTVLAGIRPAVAVTLVELGLTLPGLRTALHIEQALRLVREPCGAHDDTNPRQGGV
ncbi:STAS domain-containing protein [Streptantibioticus rubrisoli]|uniref:STAS domain-containing protein n=1 Tax=Streptantibioticus rubrisoli TaxID=1387313 RepID=A0ABT1P8G5_9ACTN|nr:STAS domain-containing protein [Streptantibioticus rubrisoli]MCQ4041086.1 STAS domain-containing protein [Streptantibioticus rubrisoli]